MLKKALKTTAALLVSAALLAGCKGTLDADNDLVDQIINIDQEAAASEMAAIDWLPDVEIHNFIMPEPGEKIAVMTVKDYGEIKIKLFPEESPKGVENFIGLAEMGYYDELIFHRIIQNFMNQGGDPKGNGTGGNSMWGGEFEGGTSENLYHFSGAVAYANSKGTSTNSSQFYIINTPDGYSDPNCVELYTSSAGQYNWPKNVAEMYNEKGGVPYLDGGYTVFGQVFEGMDVVRAIAGVKTDDNDKPTTPVIIESVRIVEYDGVQATSSTDGEQTSGGDNGEQTSGDDEDAAAANANMSGTDWLPDVDIHNFISPEPGEKIAVMNVKDYGEVKIKLFPEDAPEGVENFIGLAEDGYYDGLIFHRIIQNFMNQSGDPKGNGTGGESIWGGSFEGGTSENLCHFTGAVAYANSKGTSTNGSQFYIVNTPDGYMANSCEELHSYYPEGYNWPGNVVEMYNEKGGVPFLDGGYTVFGQVFEGMDVIRAIAEVETDNSDKPLTPVVIESIRIVEFGE